MDSAVHVMGVPEGDEARGRPECATQRARRCVLASAVCAPLVAAAAFFATVFIGSAVEISRMAREPSTSWLYSTGEVCAAVPRTSAGQPVQTLSNATHPNPRPGLHVMHCGERPSMFMFAVLYARHKKPA
jgi:hypothetical protein